MTDDERTKEAFTFASEVSKQLLTLATGVTGITVSFAQYIIPASEIWAKRCLSAGWIVYIFSVLFGIGTLMALAGTLGAAATINASSIYGKNIKLLSGGQVLAFLVATLLIVLSGILGLG